MKPLIFLLILLPLLYSIPNSKFLNDPPFLSDDKMDFTSFAQYFSSYNLTKGEIRAIFRFCDKNNEDIRQTITHSNQNWVNQMLAVCGRV